MAFQLTFRAERNKAVCKHVKDDERAKWNHKNMPRRQEKYANDKYAATNETKRQI